MEGSPQDESEIATTIKNNDTNKTSDDENDAISNDKPTSYTSTQETAHITACLPPIRESGSFRNPYKSSVTSGSKKLGFFTSQFQSQKILQNSNTNTNETQQLQPLDVQVSSNNCVSPISQCSNKCVDTHFSIEGLLQAFEEITIRIVKDIDKSQDTTDNIQEQILSSDKPTYLWDWYDISVFSGSLGVVYFYLRQILYLEKFRYYDTEDDDTNNTNILHEECMHDRISLSLSATLSKEKLLKQGRYILDTIEKKQTNDMYGPSFQCGISGQYAQDIIYSYLEEDTTRMKKASIKLETLFSIEYTNVENDQIYGWTGYLWSLLLVKYICGNQTIDPNCEICCGQIDEILLLGRQGSQIADNSAPLFYHFQGIPYIGASKGLVGILYTQQRSKKLLEPSQQSLIKSTIDWLCSIILPDGSMPVLYGNNARISNQHLVWSDGAPGMVALLCLAAQVFDSTYVTTIESIYPTIFSSCDDTSITNANTAVNTTTDSYDNTIQQSLKNTQITPSLIHLDINDLSTILDNNTVTSNEQKDKNQEELVKYAISKNIGNNTDITANDINDNSITKDDINDDYDENENGISAEVVKNTQKNCQVSLGDVSSPISDDNNLSSTNITTNISSEGDDDINYSNRSRRQQIQQQMMESENSTSISNTTNKYRKRPTNQTLSLEKQDTCNTPTSTPISTKRTSIQKKKDQKSKKNNEKHVHFSSIKQTASEDGDITTLIDEPLVQTQIMENNSSAEISPTCFTTTYQPIEQTCYTCPSRVYQNMCKRICDFIWEKGQVRNSPGLFRGICGNAYAFLTASSTVARNINFFSKNTQYNIPELLEFCKEQRLRSLCFGHFIFRWLERIQDATLNTCCGSCLQDFSSILRTDSTISSDTKKNTTIDEYQQQFNTKRTTAASSTYSSYHFTKSLSLMDGISGIGCFFLDSLRPYQCPGMPCYDDIRSFIPD